MGCVIIGKSSLLVDFIPHLFERFLLKDVNLIPPDFMLELLGILQYQE